MKPGNKTEPDSSAPGHASARQPARPGHRPPFRGPSEQLATPAWPLRSRLGPRGGPAVRVPVPGRAGGRRAGAGLCRSWRSRVVSPPEAVRCSAY